MTAPSAGRGARPEVVCLCGSTRFKADIDAANREETLKGRIVLSMGAFSHSGDRITPQQKAMLDELHRHKIDMADRVLVVDTNGYIGESTRSEIAYARRAGKPVHYRSDELRRSPAPAEGRTG